MDPEQIFVGLTLALLLVTGIDLGIAFLTRGERETTERYDV